MAGGKDPELRLGLVLYGGVSLAVYIYGVVVEVQRLLRASAEFEAASGSARGLSPGGYAEALRIAGLSRARVDIIAGTSAGGINGILLAKALATGADVGQEAVRELWLEGGAIGGLLRRLADGDGESLLSSEVMERRLTTGFDRLDEAGAAGRLKDGVLDLFVSATHLRGDRRRFRDSLGAGIDTLRHRYVFQLKFRSRYSRNDFAPRPDGPGKVGPNGHLVRLARATSAFPVAFEPVEIDEEDGVLGPQDEPRAWFADGGILNNKPFTEALQTIFTRSSDRPVRRWLLSVDPDPKAVERGIAPGPKPAFDQIAVGAVAGIPRYQSIANDLEALEEHNAAVRQVNAMVADLEWTLSRDGSRPQKTPLPYRRPRIWAWAEAIAEQLMIAARPSDPERFDSGAARRSFAEAAYRVLLAEGWDSDRWAELPDLAFELRRAYYLIKLIGMAVDPVDPLDGGDDGDGGAGPTVPDSPRTDLWQAFELITNSLWEELAAEPITLEQSPGSDALEHQASARGEERVSAALAGFGQTRDAAAGMVEEAVADAIVRLRHPAPMEGQALTFEVNLGEVFDGFRIRDEFLLPIEAGSGIRHRDLVEHAQISPATATSTGIAAVEKLAGDTAGHFGGFLKEDWRRNDLLWGRIDAAEILVGAMMNGFKPEESRRVLEQIHREILESEGHEAPDGDPYAYLRSHRIGKAKMSDLPAAELEGLKARAAFGLRGMIREAARKAEADASAPANNIRRRALIAIDGGLRTAGRIAYPYVFWLKRRARKAEPPG